MSHTELPKLLKEILNIEDPGRFPLLQSWTRGIPCKLYSRNSAVSLLVSTAQATMQNTRCDMVAVRAHGQVMTKAESIWSQALKATAHSSLPHNRLGNEMERGWRGRFRWGQWKAITRYLRVRLLGLNVYR